MPCCPTPCHQERAKAIRRAAKQLAKTFAMTKFAGVTMVPVAAKPQPTGQSTARRGSTLLAA